MELGLSPPSSRAPALHCDAAPAVAVISQHAAADAARPSEPDARRALRTPPHAARKRRLSPGDISEHLGSGDDSQVGGAEALLSQSPQGSSPFGAGAGSISGIDRQLGAATLSTPSHPACCGGSESSSAGVDGVASAGRSNGSRGRGDGNGASRGAPVLPRRAGSSAAMMAAPPAAGDGEKEVGEEDDDDDDDGDGGEEGEDEQDEEDDDEGEDEGEEKDRRAEAAQREDAVSSAERMGKYRRVCPEPASETEDVTDVQSGSSPWRFSSPWRPSFRVADPVGPLRAGGAASFWPLLGSELQLRVLKMLHPRDLLALRATHRAARAVIARDGGEVGTALYRECQRYLEDLHRYNLMRRSERTRGVRSPLRRQSEVSADIRAIVVDWMVALSLQFQCHLHTQFLAVRSLDRVLDAVAVPRSEVQLVGAVCLLLACKMEETSHPPIQDVVRACEDLYSAEQVVMMERVVLAKLDWAVSSPTVAIFVQYLFQECSAPPEVRAMAYYLSEQSLLDARVAAVPPSLVAAAIVALSFFAFGKSYADVLHYSGYTQAQVQLPARCIIEMHEAAPFLRVQRIRADYLREQHFGVAARRIPRSFLA